MQTQNISFCDKIGLNIKSNEVKKKIISDLEEIRIVQKHHEVFDQSRHENRLKKVPHMLSIKSNGNPYYMYFTRINFTNTIVMIDKKVLMGYEYPRMIIVRLCFKDDHLFDNTLLEGEMIRDNSAKWLYLISDLHVYKGKSVRDLDLIKRVNSVYSLLENHFQQACNDLFHIQVKKYCPLKESLSFHNEFIPSLNYTCRGLYFKPLYSKFKDILFNFDNNLVSRNLKPKLKTKYDFVTNDTIRKENIAFANKTNHLENKIEIKKEHRVPKETTILKDTSDTSDTSDSILTVFYIQKTEIPDLYKMYDRNNVFVDNVCVDSLKTSKMLNKHFLEKTMLEKSKFECTKTKNKYLSTTWVPIRAF